MAADENPELGVQITLRSDTAQGKEAANVVRSVGTAAEEAAAQSERAGSAHANALGKIVSGSRAASGAMRGLIETTKGGTDVINGMARAVNDLWLLISSGAASAGPWALLALGIGVVIGVLRHLSQLFGKTKDDMKEVLRASEHLGAAWAKWDLEKTAHDLHEVNKELEAQAANAKAAEAAAAALRAEEEKQVAISRQLATAHRKAGVEAQINAINQSPGLSDEEKALRIGDLRRGETSAEQVDKAKSEEDRLFFQQAGHQQRIRAIDRDQGVRDSEAFNTLRQADSAAFARTALERARQPLLESLQNKKTTEGIDKQIDSLLRSAGPEGAIPENVQSEINRLRAQKTSITDSDKSLLQRIDQLNAGIATLTKAIEGSGGLVQKSEDAKAAADRERRVGETEKGGIRALQSAEGKTTAGRLELQGAQFSAGVSPELVTTYRSVLDAQNRLTGLSGEAFNAQQMVINRQVSLYQSLVGQQKRTIRELENVQRAANNGQTFQNGGF